MRKRQQVGPFSRHALDSAYAAGREDHAAGRGRLDAARVTAFSLGSWDFFAPGGRIRFDARVDAYIRGYEDAMRTHTVRLDAPPADNSGLGGRMASMQDLEYQRELLAELVNFLEQLQERLTATTHVYDKRVGQIHEAGLWNEAHAHFRALAFEPTAARIRSLVEAIGAEDLVRAKRMLAMVEDNLAQLGRT